MRSPGSAPGTWWPWPWRTCFSPWDIPLSSWACKVLVSLATFFPIHFLQRFLASIISPSPLQSSHCCYLWVYIPGPSCYITVYIPLPLHVVHFYTAVASEPPTPSHPVQSLCLSTVIGISLPLNISSRETWIWRVIGLTWGFYLGPPRPPPPNIISKISPPPRPPPPSCKPFSPYLS